MNEIQQVINIGFFNAAFFIMQQNLLRTETLPLASMSVMQTVLLAGSPWTVALFNARGIMHQNQGSPACRMTWIQWSFDGVCLLGTPWLATAQITWQSKMDLIHPFLGGHTLKRSPAAECQTCTFCKRIPILTHHKLLPLPWRLWSTMRQHRSSLQDFTEFETEH